MLKLYVMMKTMARDESGATIVEYGVALTIVAAITVAVLTQLGDDVAAQFLGAEQMM